MLSTRLNKKPELNALVTESGSKGLPAAWQPLYLHFDTILRSCRYQISSHKSDEIHNMTGILAFFSLEVSVIWEEKINQEKCIFMKGNQRTAFSAGANWVRDDISLWQNRQSQELGFDAKP